jgi:Cu-Zn family superoxide dismutase
MRTQLFMTLALGIAYCNAATVTIPMYLTNESQTLVGSVTATDTQYGVEFMPKLANLVPSLTAGVHGFHIHENPSCAKAGMAAGGHYDPQNTKHHMGPYNSTGHLGDLPAIYINADGSVTTPVVAPRLKVKDIVGRSLMIHNGGDNYSDTPLPTGGGGPRMACGVIPGKTE